MSAPPAPCSFCGGSADREDVPYHFTSTVVNGVACCSNCALHMVSTSLEKSSADRIDILASTTLSILSELKRADNDAAWRVVSQAMEEVGP